jgi:hypothetical protein
MTTAFAALLLGVAGAALLLAIFAYLWVNRTPSAEERFDEHGRVPLFGVDIAAGTARMTAASPAASPAASAASSASTRQNVANASVPIAIHDVTESEPAIRSETPSDIATAAPVNERELEIRQFTTFAKPTPGVTPPGDIATSSGETAPNSEVPHARERDFRPGWGPEPGWPVTPAAGLPVTPRYNAPIAGPPGRARPIANGNYAGANGASNGTSDAGRPGSSGLHSGKTAHASNGNGYLGAAANGDLSQIPGAVTDGHSVRYATPAEGTLQFLPGRLEISTGLDTGREIRFVRSPGPNGTEVTFGRNEGPIYRHIQLRDQTVSREHARMEFAEGHWTLTNLSRTNPVAHNGRILRHSEEQQLTDGDRLEMGEVIFSFRSR